MSRGILPGPVTPHRWRLHKWRHTGVSGGLFGLVEQCERCRLVVHRQLLLDETTYCDPDKVRAAMSEEASDGE